MVEKLHIENYVNNKTFINFEISNGFSFPVFVLSKIDIFLKEVS